LEKLSQLVGDAVKRGDKLVVLRSHALN